MERYTVSEDNRDIAALNLSHLIGDCSSYNIGSGFAPNYDSAKAIISAVLSKKLGWLSDSDPEDIKLLKKSYTSKLVLSCNPRELEEYAQYYYIAQVLDEIGTRHETRVKAWKGGAFCVYVWEVSKYYHDYVDVLPEIKNLQLNWQDDINRTSTNNNLVWPPQNNW